MKLKAEKSRPESNRFRAMLASLIFGLMILLMKAYAAFLSDSSALRSDALESSVNVIAAAFGLGSLIFAEKPADQDHPYGHGKIEYFAQAFEGGLISLAGFLILFDTLTRVVQGHVATNIGGGLKINLMAGAMNGILGFILYRIGKSSQSPILTADGIHLLSDLATTIAVGLGLYLSILTGWSWIDPVLAIGVSFLLFATGFKLVGSSANALLDAQDDGLIAEITTHLNSMEPTRIISFHGLKAQRFGRDKHVDLHLVVPEFLSVKDSHDLAEQFSKQLGARLGSYSEVHSHIDPCNQNHCENCDENPCPIRKKPFQEKRQFKAVDLLKNDQSLDR